ncbi:MAG: hypothetical protein WCJ46_04020 [bacterium]
MKKIFLFLTLIFTLAAGIQAGNEKVYNDLLTAATSGGKPESLYHRAIVLEPQRVQAYVELAKFYLESGEAGAQEIEVMEQKVFVAGLDNKNISVSEKTLPALREAAVTVAAYYLLEGRLNDATGMLDTAEKIAPETKAIICLRGVLAGKKDNWDDAKSYALKYQVFDAGAAENKKMLELAGMTAGERKVALTTMGENTKPLVSKNVEEKTKEEIMMDSLRAKKDAVTSDAREQTPAKEVVDETDAARKTQIKEYIDREAKELEKLRLAAGDDKEKLKEYAKKMKKLREKTMEFTGGKR